MISTGSQGFGSAYLGSFGQFWARLLPNLLPSRIRVVSAVNVRTVREQLGHESLATTQKYLEPSKETEKQLEEMKLPFQNKGS
jgi:integrase